MNAPSLAAVWALIRSIDESGDTRRSVGSEADQHIAVLGSILADPAASDAEKHDAGELLDLLRWYRWRALPDRLHGEAEIQAAAETFVPFFFMAADPSGVAPEGLMPALVAHAATLVGEACRQAMTTGNPELHDVAVDGCRRIVAATPAGDPDRAARVSNLATALWMRHECLGTASDLERAIATAADAVNAIREGRPENASILSTFGATLLKRFHLAGAEADVETCIGLFRGALDAGPVDRAERAVILQNLGAALMAHHELSGSTTDVADAVSALEGALAAFPEGQREHTAALSNLGTAMFARFKESGVLDDLERSVALASAALEAAPQGQPDYANYKANHAMYLASLGEALVARYRTLGAVADVEAAVDALREALKLTADDAPHAMICRAYLGTALLERFREAGMAADGNEAVELLRASRDADVLGSEDHAVILADLAGAYQARFERFGAVKDSDDAIDVMRAALDAFAAGGPEHAGGLANLAAALKGRFDRTGAAADLNAAVEAAQTAAHALPADSPHRTAVQLNLGAALYDRFSHQGALADLDGAVEAAQKAAGAAPPEHPALADCLSNLGNALRTRFAEIGDSADLDRAVREGRAAVEACPKGHVRRPSHLLNLSKSLLLRFERSAVVEDVDEAVAAARDAVDACPPDNPGHAECLGALADVLTVRATTVESAKDLDDAVDIARRALEMSPPSHSARSSRLLELGDTLHTRFQRFGKNPADRDEAVRVLRAALEDCPPDAAPQRATRQAALGSALKSRFDSLGDERDAREAFQLLAQAGRTQFATPSQRVEACRVAADVGAAWYPHESAELLEMAISLLPELAGRHLERADHHHALGRLFGLTSNAAALAMADAHEPEAGRAARALRLLEAGRAVLLSQALDTRTDLNDLQAAHPELARRYTELRDLLDPSDPVPFAGTAETAARPDRRALSAEFDALVEQIQREQGFASFNKLPDADELLKHASDGPIATINVSTYRSDAILLTSEAITSVPLPELRLAELTHQIVAFHTALAEVTDRSLSSADRQQAQAVIRSVLAWLWDTVAEPVLKALRFDAACRSDDWPRMWWAPGGLLGLLPLHAAGRPENPGESVLDRVVSSYTPTVRALQHARRQAATARAASARSLIVAMPTTPGPPDIPALPGTALEAALVATRLPEPTILLEPNPHSPTQAHDATPTRRAVLERLPDCSIAHFACHGQFDFRDPSRSRLLLHDHATAPLTIADLAPVRLERVELAYLSACETAFNMSRLIDESLHLAAAFQITGFPRVIGTLWAILDGTAATVADAFYAGLAPSAGEALEPSRSAFALHHAVRALRDKGPNRNLPSIWAAYQHYGA